MAFSIASATRLGSIPRLEKNGSFETATPSFVSGEPAISLFSDQVVQFQYVDFAMDFRY